MTASDAREVGFHVGERSTSGLWHPVDGAVAVAVVAPGAGSTVRGPYFDGIVDGLAEERIATFRFDFVYGHEGRRSPDRPPVLLATWRAALAEAQTLAEGSPLAAMGKSMGGRYASMVAAEDGAAFAAKALVFFGYPLHAPATPDKQRSEHLGAITVPMLFIEGTRDPFAQRGLLQPVVDALGPDRARIEWIEGGDHSHRVRGAARSDGTIGRDLGRIAASFVRDVVSGEDG
jgi:predicted alpha/beta-hydrolase family hydrolase